MENGSPEDRAQQPSYPEPTSLFQDPYPALAPDSAHTNGPRLAPAPYRPASSASRTYDSVDGLHPYSQFSSQDQGASQDGSFNGLGHHVTDFGAFSVPDHFGHGGGQLSEAQQLAEQFHVMHGDPGAKPAMPVPRPQHAQVEGDDAPSGLAGIWEDSDVGGGRAAASRAWQASKVYGAESGLDVRAGSEVRDPDVDALLDQEALELFPTPGGPAKKKTRSGRGGWRQLLKGTDHENVGKTPSGRPRGSTRGGRAPRGRRKAVVAPDKAFTKLLQLANKAFMDQDWDEAADYARQAIQNNPEIYMAHSLLAQILEKQGRMHDSVQALKHGAPTARSAQAWLTVCERILALAGSYPTKAQFKEAMECLIEALNLKTDIKDNPNVEYAIRRKRIWLGVEMDDLGRARNDCRSMLTRFPKATRYCLEYARLCHSSQDKTEIAKAKEMYDNAFALYDDHEVFGDPEDKDTIPMEHLNIYLELVEGLANPREGLKKAKQVARWLLGRKNDSFWDRYEEDDREFDDKDDRRELVGEWKDGDVSRDLAKYGEGLPVEVKIRMGLVRLRMGVSYYGEALKHFASLFKELDYVEEVYDEFLVVANALRECGCMKEACDYYDHLRKRDNADDPDYGLGEKVWMQMGTTYALVNRTADAVAAFEAVTLRKGQNYPRACAKLAKLYEDNNELDKAMYLCNEVILLNRREMLYEARVRMVPPAVRSAPGRRAPDKLLVAPTLSTTPPASEVSETSPAANDAPQSDLPPALQALRDFELAGDSWRTTYDQMTDEINAQKAFAHRIRKGSSGRDSQSLIASSTTSRPTTPVARASHAWSDSTADPGQQSRSVKRKRNGKNGTSETGADDLGNGGEEEEESEEPTPKRRRQMPLKAIVPTKAAFERQQRYRELKSAEDHAREQFKIIQSHWPAFKEGKDEQAVQKWSRAAHSMLEAFTAMKIFFPDHDKMIPVREYDVPGRPIVRSHMTGDVTTPTGFLSIPFSEWHHIFTDLALLYAGTGEQEKCYNIVQRVLFAANVFFQNPDLHWASFGAAIYCGLVFNDSQYLIELARKLITDSNSRAPEAFRLLAAVNRFPYGSNWFSAGPTQKFMLRSVKMFDYLSMPNDLRNQVDWSAQKNSLVSRMNLLANQPDLPTEPSVQVLLTYGHMVAVANHAYSALPYYYRALSLEPDNVCVNLSLATMWIQNSMKRQVDNRQHGITQGLAFLYRYHDLRAATGKACHLQEAEFNVGRMWHYLGLTHLAIPTYEKVLKLSEKVQAERAQENEPLDCDTEDFAAEAAFALQNIYSLAGNGEAARAITEEWLVL